MPVVEGSAPQGVSATGGLSKPSTAVERAGLRGAALQTLLFSSLGALAFGLSFPLSSDFVAGWPLAFVWPALLAAAALRAPSRRFVAISIAPTFGLALLAHEWWMGDVTGLGMPVLVAYLALWMVALGILVRAIAGPHAATRWPCIVALPVALVAVEFLRGDLVCTGYAWFFAAHPLVEWPAFAQVASLGGGWLVSGVAALFAGSILDGIFRGGRTRIVSPIVGVGVMLMTLAFGSMRLEELDSHSTKSGADDSATFLLVQTDLPMSNKLDWEPEAQIEDFLGFARLSLQGADAARARGESIDVVVWPETMLPGFGLEPESIKALVDGNYYPGNRYDEAMRDLSSRLKSPMIVGSPAFIGLRVEASRFRWDNQFNSAYLIDPSGKLARTDKIFLTPFGETMPIISNWNWLERQLLSLGADGMSFDLDTAANPQRFELSTAAGKIHVGVPICFEITAPWASRRIAFDGSVRKAQVLVNISNDGWFSTSRAGRRQHLQVAQLRAIELATPVVRCANTGRSAWIDEGGRVVASLPPQVADTLIARPRPAGGTPLAARVGDGVAWCALVAAVVLSARPRRLF